MIKDDTQESGLWSINRRMKTAWVKAKVLEASDRGYLEALLPLLGRARKEIVISLYLMEPNDEAGPYHPVNRLLEALLQALARGVRVTICLNTRFRMKERSEVARGKYFERLLEGGVEIFTLLTNRRLHDKLIVIDRRFVVEGSMNWSVSALTSNYESVSLIDSPVHAEKKLKRIALLMLPPLPKEKEHDRPLLAIPETVEFPRSLLQKDRLGKMIAASDARSIDLYLLLWGQAAAQGKPEFELDLETAGRALSLPSRWERSRIRRQMIKVLKKLADRYELIEVEFPFGRNVRVQLIELPGERVPIPGWIFSSDYLANESSGTVFLTIAREILKREGIEIDSLSAVEVEERFGIGKTTILHARASSKD